MIFGRCWNVDGPRDRWTNVRGQRTLISYRPFQPFPWHSVLLVDNLDRWTNTQASTVKWGGTYTVSSTYLQIMRTPARKRDLPGIWWRRCRVWISDALYSIANKIDPDSY